MASLDGKYWYSEEACNPTRAPISRIETETSPCSRARSRAAASTSSIVACRRRARGPSSYTVGILEQCLDFVKRDGALTPTTSPPPDRHDPLGNTAVVPPRSSASGTRSCFAHEHGRRRTTSEARLGADPLRG